MKQSHSIILAVVSANDVIANLPIIQLAREVGPFRLHMVRIVDSDLLRLAHKDRDYSNPSQNLKTAQATRSIT